MRVGVLGGGLVGLVVAGHAAPECEVLEADDVVGGHCRSLRHAYRGEVALIPGAGDGVLPGSAGSVFRWDRDRDE